MQEPLDYSSEASSHQREVLGLPPREGDRADADPFSGEVAEHSPLQEGTAPVASPKPIQELRDRAWDELCSDTDYETRQLLGDVGAPEDTLFTYEEAVRHHHCQRGLTLYVGEDIIPVEGDRVSEMSERNRCCCSVCCRGGGGMPSGGHGPPAERVLQVPNVRGCSRVTIAMVVSFPPEPFYFANLAHLDGVIRVWNKVAHKAKAGVSGELLDDGPVKAVTVPYSRLWVPNYGHSVPVQELLKKSRWEAFQEGRWGNRLNPPPPLGM